MLLKKFAKRSGTIGRVGRGMVACGLVLLIIGIAITTWAAPRGDFVAGAAIGASIVLNLAGVYLLARTRTTHGGYD